MTKDLAQFDSLKADISMFVAPIKSIKVIDFKTSSEAIEAGKQVKSLMKQVEDKRKGLVGPLNDEVKFINQYAKDIVQPLEDAANYIGALLNKFAAEQEKIKQEQLRRAEEDRRAQEARAAEERKRVADEMEAKRQAELAALNETHSEAAELFGSTGEPDQASEDQRKEIEERNERERLEAEARLDREAAVREGQAQATAFDINQNQIKGARKNWKVEIIDITKVPKEFLIITLNDKMALACARAGNTDIPGLKFSQDISVSLGSKTYVPRRALEG